ncbi:hypothetical protein [Desulfosporosinus sp. I2]|uniref:hypothetical protein n=1 Tax=Desulfosporosinus sp. I2 TaxID=1617025 RepID=UPI0005ED44A2|nr:hypothetical protein [Desulfosporosinus sp. I2]
MPVIIEILAFLLLGVFTVFLNRLCNQSSKKLYLELLIKLEENPDDKAIKAKIIEAERACNRFYR